MSRKPTRHYKAHIRVVRAHLVVLDAPVFLCQNLFIDHLNGVVAFLDHNRRHFKQLLWLEVGSLKPVTAGHFLQVLCLVIVDQVHALPLQGVFHMPQDQLTVVVRLFPVDVVKVRSRLVLQLLCQELVGMEVEIGDTCCFIRCKSDRLPII